MIEIVTKKKIVLAYIIRSYYRTNGIEFITPDNLSQQVAYMHHPTGKIIDSHTHNLV